MCPTESQFLGPFICNLALNVAILHAKHKCKSVCGKGVRKKVIPLMCTTKHQSNFNFYSTQPFKLLMPND